MIHLSTDFVFDGRSDRLYTEEDLPAPLNYYGVTKYQGEQAVASICRNYAIVRVVVVYGKALPGQHGNVLQLVKNAWKQARDPCRRRSISHTDLVEDIADGVERLVHTDDSGIYHICGAEYLSIAEWHTV